ncbi:MAG: PAS domain-containing sensor histidine kinase [bacterium]
MDIHSLIDEIDVMVWSLKSEDKVKYVNVALANFFGRGKNYYANKSTGDGFNAQEIELLFDNNNTLVFNEKKRIRTEKWIVNSNGESRLLSITKVPKLSSQGRVIEIICNANDITEQERLKQALDITIDNLNASEEFLLMNFQESNNGIILTDKKGKIIMFNDQIARILGYEKTDLISLNLFDIIHPEDTNKIDYMLNILQKRKIKNFNIDKRLMTRNGGYLWVNFHCSLTNNKNIEATHLLFNIEDISEKKSAEATIREQREEIRHNREELEFNKLKNKFFTNLSHEFKTPINLIFSSLHIMEMYLNKHESLKDDEKLDTYISIIKQNGNRLLRLVYNLIDLTKMDINDYNLSLKKCDIVELLKNIADSVRFYMEDNKRKFSFQPSIESKEIVCDPLNIERVILNLLSNAIKFTNKGDNITLSLVDNKDRVIISVKDTGIGIKEEKQKLIFEQFRQVNETFSRETEGSGIGLSIAKCLVEMHGGSISVNSIYGDGSDFIIELPVKIESHSDESGLDKVEEFTNKVDIEFSDIY